MSHLTPDELVDIIEGGALDTAVQTHVDECEQCRARLATISAALTEARMVTVPEPSPLFWERLSDRVRLEIAAEPLEPSRSARWLQWPVLVPLTGLAAIILALTSVITPRIGSSDPTGETQIAAIEPAPEETDVATVEDTWTLVSDMVGPLDLEAAREAGFVTGPGAADGAILHLTADEQEELVRLLRQELGQPGG